MRTYRFPGLAPWMPAAALAVVTALAACSDHPADEAYGPNLDVVSGSCPTSDVTVASWDELVGAVATATPGMTIGIAGTIAVGGGDGLWITTEGVTITCATPGAGLTVADGATFPDMLNLRAPAITVTGLVLDARATHPVETIFAFYDGVDAFGERPRIVNNTLRCGVLGDNQCISLLGGLNQFAIASGGRIEGNRLEGPATDQFTFGIHVQGFRDVVVERNVVTTLAPGAGSGIAVNLSHHVVVRDNHVSGPWASDVWLFDRAPATRIVGNRLRGATQQAILVDYSDSVVATGNHAKCGTACVLFDGAPEAVVSDNLFQAAEPISGVQFQGGTDGTQIVDNRVLTVRPSTNPVLGGISISDGSGVLVAGNVVEGPWANGVAAVQLADVTIERNKMLGPTGFGLLLGMDRSTVSSNRVSHAGGGGLRLQSGCFNRFTHNVLTGNDPGAVFDEATGANSYWGDSAPVLDLGNFDCDGDGLRDPNQIFARLRAASQAAPAEPAGAGGGSSSLRRLALGTKRH